MNEDTGVSRKMKVTVLSLTPLMHLCGAMRIIHMWAQLATASFVWRLCCGDIILFFIQRLGAHLCTWLKGSKSLCLHAVEGSWVWLKTKQTNPIKLKKERKEEMKKESRVLQSAQKLSSARMLNPISFLSRWI